jgi:hypothetical protein
MHTYTRKNEKRLLSFFCFVAVATLIIALSVPLQGYAAQASEKVFAAPEEAVKALVDALKADNMEELGAIFGPAGKEVLSSGDATEDRAGRERFLKAYETKNALIKDGDAKVVLQIGTEEWPFPIPIVRRGEKWSFDTRKGEEELINRRIGRNELNTIQTCLAYVDAQREYALKDRDGDGLMEYAQKFRSDPGNKNGLYWEVKAGEAQSPLGPLFAAAQEKGYRAKAAGGKPVPYHGYYYRILTGQGKNAPGGAYDYMVKGNMIGGFALVAYPAKYGSSGIMTFIVNHDGVVYQKDLGKSTEKSAVAMKLFNPDQTWKRAQ